MKSYGIILACVLLVGCGYVNYRSSSGSSFKTAWLGTKSVSGLSVNRVGNDLVVSLDSAKSDTQSMSEAISKIADIAKGSE